MEVLRPKDIKETGFFIPLSQFESPDVKIAGKDTLVRRLSGLGFSVQLITKNIDTNAELELHGLAEKPKPPQRAELIPCDFERSPSLGMKKLSAVYDFISKLNPDSSTSVIRSRTTKIITALSSAHRTALEWSNLPILLIDSEPAAPYEPLPKEMEETSINMDALRSCLNSETALGRLAITPTVGQKAIDTMINFVNDAIVETQAK